MDVSTIADEVDNFSWHVCVLREAKGMTKNMKKICIYGTGKWGKLIYGLLRELGCNILSFCRTEVNKNEMLCDLNVIKIEDIAEEHKKDIIMLIAIRDIKSVVEIKRKLLDNNFKENQIIDINNFVLDNIDILTPSQGKDLSDRYKCICCNHNIKGFLPGGEKGSKLFAQNKVIGGGFRDNNICPVCGSSDRIRWQKYVYTHFTNILKEECTVLHFAPEDYIYTLIRKNINCDYYTGDIEIGKAQNRIDITDIQFRNDFFDYVIANHVLEHIIKMDKAFNEIKRVSNLYKSKNERRNMLLEWRRTVS